MFFPICIINFLFNGILFGIEKRKHEKTNQAETIIWFIDALIYINVSN